MSKTSTISCAVSVNGDGSAFSHTPPQSPVANPNAPEGGAVSFALGAGANTIPVPAGSLWLMVEPPITSTNPKSLRKVSGDTGAPVTSQLEWICVAGLSNVYINATAAETVTLLWG